ncbi:hypothetical protein ACFXTN_008511 [Malus domestica]
MASETSTNGNFNVQGLGPRRSTRLNTMMSGAAPPPQGTTVATTTAATLGKAHCLSCATSTFKGPNPNRACPSCLSPTRCQAEP